MDGAKIDLESGWLSNGDIIRTCFSICPFFHLSMIVTICLFFPFEVPWLLLRLVVEVHVSAFSPPPGSHAVQTGYNLAYIIPPWFDSFDLHFMEMVGKISIDFFFQFLN